MVIRGIKMIVKHLSLYFHRELQNAGQRYTNSQRILGAYKTAFHYLLASAVRQIGV